jgi:hypothetical protein
MRALALAAALAALGGSTRVARADAADDKKKAARLFKEGRALITAGKIDEACPKFVESYALDPAIGTKLNIADCYEQQDKLVLAYRVFDEAAVDAAKTSTEGRESFAAKRRDALAAKLVVVELAVTDPTTSGMVITLGGEPVPAEAWGQPQVALPGAIVVEATAPFRKGFHESVDGAPGGRVTVTVPPLAPDVARVDPSADIPGTGATSYGFVPIDTEPTHPTRRLSYVVGGAGAGMLAGSLVLGLVARNRFREAACGENIGRPAGECTPQGDEQADSARRLADVGTGFALAGAAAVGVGVWLFLRTGEAPSSGDHALFAPSITNDSVGVIVTFER